MRVVFAGTPVFARESLRALVAADMRPVAVLTQPDRPAGRGNKQRASAVKIFALENDLPIMQPESLNSEIAIRELEALKADLLVVVAYGLLLPQAAIDSVKVACVNVHASRLPRWRGAAPIQAAILAGDQRTGISLMQMDAGLDSGPVYAKSSLDIGVGETAGELHHRLAEQGAKFLVHHLEGIVSGSLNSVAQDEAGVCYAAKIHTQDAKLEWTRSAARLARVVRAYNPVPGAWTMLNGERLKCWRAQAMDGNGMVPGTIIRSSAEGIDVACSKGLLRMTALQRQGRRPVTAGEFANQVGPGRVVLG